MSAYHIARLDIVVENRSNMSSQKTLLTFSINTFATCQTCYLTTSHDVNRKHDPTDAAFPFKTYLLFIYCINPK